MRRTPKEINVEVLNEVMTNWKMKINWGEDQGGGSTERRRYL